MKVVILAGGFGTRISEETHLKPKPMIEIGGHPILWHIMKMYSEHGMKDFIICCGYMGYVIKEYFSNYVLHMSDITVDMREDRLYFHRKNAEDWRVTLVDTGRETMTGGRLLRVADYLLADEPFCFTYGDGVADVNIAALVKHHKSSGKLATITAVSPPGRYGALVEEDGIVRSFIEKPKGDGGKINGGFFVLSTKVFDFISDDSTSWEAGPLQKLAEIGELTSYNHDGFFQPMDTLRDKNMLQRLWDNDSAPWKIWS